MNQESATKQKSKSQTCKANTKRIVLHCGKLGLRRALIIIACINIIWAMFAFIMFWNIERTPLPPLLGFTWESQMRVTLLPEVCVSGGLAAYLLYGAVKENTQALLVSILCQWLLVMGSFVFGFLYLLNIAITPKQFQAFVWLYFALRVYILVLSMQYLYVLIGGDPWAKYEEDMERAQIEGS